MSGGIGACWHSRIDELLEERIGVQDADPAVPVSSTYSYSTQLYLKSQREQRVPWQLGKCMLLEQANVNCRRNQPGTPPRILSTHQLRFKTSS